MTKRIGFLSFGHWHPSTQSATRTGSDALVQSIELTVAAEELGLDGAFFRVHHFARQPASPFPLLAAIGPRLGSDTQDQVGFLDGGLARFGKSYIGEPDAIAAELTRDAAVAAADTLLVTVPNQLGVDYDAHLLASIAEHVAPAIGWAPAAPLTPAGAPAPSTRA